MQNNLIEFHSIGKRFPGVVSLDGVSFGIRRGACHAIMGENGAGKSTLGKILAGVYRADAGQMAIGGVRKDFHTPLDALSAGVGLVHQELVFCPNLTVAENLCLSALPRHGPLLDRRSMRTRAREFLLRVGATCDPDAPMSYLSTAQEQLVQIAAVLASGAKVIVMDEPTSSLSEADTLRLHKLIAELRSSGATIVYVSHRMDEIFKICDWITVLRDGHHVATLPAAETNHSELVRLMIGRTVDQTALQPAQVPQSDELLRVDGLYSPGKFDNVSFSIRAGEVLGIAGLVGSGRSEVALAVFGMDPRSGGTVYVRGQRVDIRSPRQAMNLGIGLVPEDRKRQGLVLGMTCGENITLSVLDSISKLGWIRGGKRDGIIQDFFGRLQIRATGADVPAAGLSGGNQQKLVLAKWLARSCKILIIDEPTRGVDVGGKSEIHGLIREFVASGCAVLMISSELPEVISLCTRVIVLREGRLAGELDQPHISQQRIMEYMAGAPSLACA